MHGSPRPRPLRLSWRRKVLFALVPLLGSLVLGEALARSFREGKAFSPLRGGSYREQRIDLIRRGYPAAHDAQLGYVPKPGFASADNRWAVMVSIDERGLRTNGAGARPVADKGVLAVGDSFTFGDQVADGDTWPARLERRLARPVWNGGVFGYSFAQTVLRAEQLLEQLPVDTLVVSLIPDDIKRCELRRRFTEVPWFDLVDGELVLQNVPVPDTDRGEASQQWLRQLLGHSALCDTLFWNTVPAWWVGDQREIPVHARGVGSVIAERLLDRLVARCRQREVELLLVLQDAAEPADWSRADGQRLLAYCRRIGVPFLDLQTSFDELAAADPSLRQQWFCGHMTAAGNAWVADQIAAVMLR